MEVPDSSFTLFVILTVVVTALVSGGLFLLYKFLKARKRINYRKIHYKTLKKVNFSEPKKAAYTITESGRFFAEDSERVYEAYENLVDRLEPYKYRKEVRTIDDETRSYYKIYLEMIDV